MKTEFDNKQQAWQLDANYTGFLRSIKERLKIAQLRAARAANQELIYFYWELGKDLIEKQKAFKWGEHFLEQFSHDMRIAFPEMQGFSIRNLQRMRKFASFYPDISIAAQAVSQLPWGHLVVLLQKIRDRTVQEWYAQQSFKNGWSRAVLEMQIEGQLYERQATADKKLSNYQEHACPYHRQTHV